MQHGKAFSSFNWRDGHIADLDPGFPSYLSAVSHPQVPYEHPATFRTAGEDTHFGYVHAGGVALNHPDMPFCFADAGMFFCLPGHAKLTACKAGTQVALISRRDWLGMPMIGGTIEREGRLKYIDGCTDSLLVPPVKMGDPCLNLLYFPPGIDQTMHTHPSDRIGVILSGRGVCRAVNDGIEETIELEPGMLFCIHAGGQHAFATTDSELRVLAYHPDSDFGPTDEGHPMLNRTIIDGVSAADPSRAQYRTA